MSQRVPSWENNQFTDTYNDIFHPPNLLAPVSTANKLILSRNIDSNISDLAPEVPIFDYEWAELTWKNGQLALHGLGQSRIPMNLATSTSAPWLVGKEPGSSGTLESVVNQTTCFFNPSFNDKPLPCFPLGDELVPWFNQHASAASATKTMDALVPLGSNTNNNNLNKTNDDIILEDSNGVPGGVGGFTNVDSCSAGMNNLTARSTRRGLRQVPVVGQEWSNRSEYSANGSRLQFTLDTCTERDQGTAFTSTSMWSADNTSSGMLCTKLTGDDHDSISLSKSIMKNGGSGENKKKGSSSTKRSRAEAAIHNQSERKRRDKINRRMKTLQKLVPNSNKTDKASMLDEVIKYLKQLQAQVTMINRMNISMPQMPMLPMTLNEQAALQMSMMTPMGATAMGMNGMMDMSAAAAMAAGRANMHVAPLMHPSAFLPMQPSWDPVQAVIPPDPISAFLAYQYQPMTMDIYRMMMASLYQKMQQAQQQVPNSKS